MNYNLHPEINKVLPVWKRIRVLVEEDEKHYPDEEYFFRFPNERADAYTHRAKSFMYGFVNFAGFLARAKGDMIYSKAAQREGLTGMQERFLDMADRFPQPLKEILHNEAAPILSAYGTVFAVVDKTSEELATRADEEAKGVPYLTILSPFQVKDFQFGEDGELNWFQYTVKDDTARAPGVRDAGTTPEALVTWTRETYSITGSTGKAETKPNPFGFVPVVMQAQFVDPNKTIGKSSFFTTSRYIFAGNNLLSAGNSEVFKNAAAIILMQIQDYTDEVVRKPTDEESGRRQMLQDSKEFRDVLVYEKDRPEYLSRDLDLIDKAAAMGKDYFERALENERSALSVGTAKVPESGVARAYEFTTINGVLASFASAMELFETSILRMVARMSGETDDGFTVTYPKDFDIRTFNERVAFVKELLATRFPSELGIRAAYKTLTPEITEAEAERVAINQEIDAAPLGTNNEGDDDGTERNRDDSGGQA